VLTLKLVQRDRNKTVTGELPILIPCESHEQEGTATFLSPEPPAPQPVRLFAPEEFERDFDRLIRTRMLAYERKLLLAFRMWMDASRRKDLLAMQHAQNRVWDALQLRREQNQRAGLSPDDLEMGRILGRYYGLPEGQEIEAIARHDGYSIGPRGASEIRLLLSEEISKALDSVRLVLWFSSTGFRIALYCPHFKTALYFFCLMSFVSGVGIAVCPKCGKLFRQERPNQNYCSIAHREAHRVARWRASQAKKSKKGEKHGSRKTR